MVGEIITRRITKQELIKALENYEEDEVIAAMLTAKEHYNDEGTQTIVFPMKLKF